VTFPGVAGCQLRRAAVDRARSVTSAPLAFYPNKGGNGDASAGGFCGVDAFDIEELAARVAGEKRNGNTTTR